MNESEINHKKEFFDEDKLKLISENDRYWMGFIKNTDFIQQNYDAVSH